jgi:ribosomal protein L24
MNEKDYNVSHTTTKHQEAYVINFDNKEFLVRIKDCQKHHKDYPEITEVEIIQSIHPLDIQKINKILSKLKEDKRIEK